MNALQSHKTVTFDIISFRLEDILKLTCNLLVSGLLPNSK